MGKAVLRKAVPQNRAWDIDDHMSRSEVARALRLTYGQVRRAEVTGLNKLFRNDKMRAWADER